MVVLKKGKLDLAGIQYVPSIYGIDFSLQHCTDHLHVTYITTSWSHQVSRWKILTPQKVAKEVLKFH